MADACESYSRLLFVSRIRACSTGSIQAKPRAGVSLPVPKDLSNRSSVRVAQSPRAFSSAGRLWLLCMAVHFFGVRSGRMVPFEFMGAQLGIGAAIATQQFAEY